MINNPENVRTMNLEGNHQIQKIELERDLGILIEFEYFKVINGLENVR